MMVVHVRLDRSYALRRPPRLTVQTETSYSQQAKRATHVVESCVSCVGCGLRCFSHSF